MSSKRSSSSQKAKQEVGPKYLLVLGGLPGSGKSTVSKQLEEAGWIISNQDTLGTADECKKLMEKAFKHGKSVVIDRERKMWINEAKKWEPIVETLFLNIDIEICKARALERQGHATLDPLEAAQVIDEFAKGLKEPQAFEGPYSKVMIAHNPEEVGSFIKEILQYPISTKKFK